jgi:hypothetical protein
VADKDDLTIQTAGAEASPTDKAPKNKRDNIMFWRKWIPAAKEAARRHWNDSRRAWQEYDGDSDGGFGGQTRKRVYEDGAIGTAERYPIYWSRVQTVESAYYSRKPETFAKRQFGISDEIAGTMELIVDHIGEYALRTSGIDASTKASVTDYINADKVCQQICYGYSERKAKQPRQAIPDPANPEQYLDAETGQPVTEEILFEETAGYMYDAEVDEIAEQYVEVKPVIYDQVIHTPTAKMPDEILDMGYYFCLTRSEAIDKWGEKKVKSWPDSVWHKTREYDKERRDEENRDELAQGPDKFIEGWECWSSVTKKVYWVCPDYTEGFLDEKPDPYGLKCFFPSTRFVIGTKPAKTLYPTPPFVRLYPTLNMLHIMYGRVFNLIDGVRRRALVDGQSEIVELLENLGDVEFVAVQSLAGLVEKGGLDNLVWYLPVQELVSAIAELNQQDEKFKENIDEWFGTPAILQGTSDPVETATAQEIKVSAAHDRFKNKKNAIAEMVRETLEMMIDLYLNPEIFDDQKIMQITGFKYMSPEDQARFPEALAALRNDTERTIRIEIDTDTTSYVGEQVRMQQRTAVVQTLTKGLNEVAQMIQTSESMGILAMQIILESLDGLPGGIQFIDNTKRAMQEELDKMKEPPPPPPPDPNAIKAEASMVTAQANLMKAQTDQMRAQIEQMTAEVKQLKDAFDSQLKQQSQEAGQALEAGYLNNDTMRLGIEAENKAVDNDRLGIEAQAKVIEAVKPNAPEGGKAEAPTTIIVNQAPSPVPDVPTAIDTILKNV